MSKVKDKKGIEVSIGYVLKTPSNGFIIATRVDEEYLHWVDAEHSNCSGGTHAKEDFYDDMCPECEGVRSTGCGTCTTKDIKQRLKQQPEFNPKNQ